MNIVIDASIAAAWSFEDEWTSAIVDVANQVEVYGANVPQLFPTEIANVLLVAERRRRMPAGHADIQIALLCELDLTLDMQTSDRAWQDTLRLARDEGLTVYDATYLELALRLEAVLATLDKPLAKAAQRHGLVVIP